MTDATSRNDGSLDTEVVIAGGGPVGMALAIELGLRGQRCVVIEQRPRGKTFPARTNLANARTMEHFRRWGIADRHRQNDPIPPEIQRDVTFVTRLNGYVLINMEGACEWRERFPIASELPEWAPNHSIEKTLREKIESLPNVEMRWSATAEDFVQDDHSVELFYSGPDGPNSVTASFLAVADGARSSLRKRLNISLHGQSLSDNSAWLIHAPELAKQFETVPLSSFTLFINDDIQADVLIPQSGEGHWLYMLSPMPEGADPDDWETIKAMLYRSVGKEFPVDPVEGGIWVSHSRMAARYDFGRVFLAGDAAHLTSPWGGFGMNMGIGDAADLGWKLAATLQGWGGPRLLESYTIERQEAERFIIDGSTYNQSILAPELVREHMEEDSDRGEKARAEVVDLIVAEKTKEFRSLGAQLGYRYTVSPVIVRDNTEAPPLDYGEYVPSAFPGSLAPHIWLDDNTSLYDMFGEGLTLLKIDDVDTAELEDAARDGDVPLEVFELYTDEAKELYQAKLVLIRPDQHVAWRGDELPEDSTWLIDAVRGALTTRKGQHPGRVEETDRLLSQTPTGSASV